MKFIIATNNKNKVGEFKRILEPFGINVISQSEAGISVNVDETSDSFSGNSELKAQSIYNIAKCPIIADDSGLCVEALNDEPGIFSARYGGDLCKNDVERTQLLLENMKSQTNRKARFICDICLILQDEKVYHFTGECDGEIGYSPKGNNGFGYDPVFMVENKSFSEMTDDEKDKISHRGIALKKLKEEISLIMKEVN